VKPSLVFIHGWGSDSRIWASWVATYYAAYSVVLIDLPGHGDAPMVSVSSDDAIIEAWVAAIEVQIPDHAVIVGWSLGGLLAQCVAQRYPERVAGLVLLASSPCFVQRAGWSLGLDTTAFAHYRADVMPHTPALLKSFFALQVLGDPEPRARLKQLRAFMSDSDSVPAQALAQGLDILQSLDMRDALSSLSMPSLWLLAQEDAIVPVALANALTDLQPTAQVVCLPDCGHLPFLAYPDKTADAILTFIQQECVRD